MPRCFNFANSGLALVGYLWTQNCLDPQGPNNFTGAPLWVQRAPIISIVPGPPNLYFNHWIEGAMCVCLFAHLQLGNG